LEIPRGLVTIDEQNKDGRFCTDTSRDMAELNKHKQNLLEEEESN